MRYARPVQNRLRKSLDRLLVRVLSRRRGSAQAIRDVTYVREVIRVSLIFSLFVLLPMVLLALLALRNLEAELINIDAGLASRADSAADRVAQELEHSFEGFETEATDKVAGGDLAIEKLYEARPALRAVFRFDADGELGWPWASPGPDDTWPEPTAAWTQTMAEGERLNAQGRHAAAAAAFERATHAAQPAHAGTARLAMSRARLSAGDNRAMTDLLLLADDMPRQREQLGFRIFDLSTMLRAEHLLDSGNTDAAMPLLRSVVETTLAHPWSITRPGDAFVARRALDVLQGRADKRWWAAADKELEQRMQRAWWADRVADELALVVRRAGPEGEFTYQAGSRALWVLLQTPTDLWAFSFDYEAVKEQLSSRVIAPLDEVDPLLAVSLVATDSPVTDALVRRSLSPLLPAMSVSIRPRDPDALANQKWRTRTQRTLVILLSVVAGTLGIFAVAQIVNRELDNARQKADFAANVSHELRSPITQIRLKAESLQLDLCTDDADRQAHYDAIVSEAERLSRLVDNVLDFASIERGVKKYLLRPGDLGDVLLKSVESIRGAASSQDAIIETTLPDDLPVVWMDRDAIGQVATNLLSNALKYGSDGHWVGLSARAFPSEVQFSVSDRGMGIAPHDVEKIFEHYYRVDAPDVRKRRGTGIGLTIVRYIVEAHRGTISVESVLGQGTTFTVSLPLTAPPEDGGN